MDSISRDDLLTAGDAPLPVDSVYISELKKHVHVQGLSAIDRSRWERSFLRRDGSKVDPRKMLHARGSLLALCIVDGPEKRQRLYTAEDAERLGKMPAIIMEPIYDLCRRLSGIGEKDVEELEQLSAAGDGSGSASN